MGIHSIVSVVEQIEGGEKKTYIVCPTPDAEAKVINRITSTMNPDTTNFFMVSSYDPVVTAETFLGETKL